MDNEKYLVVALNFDLGQEDYAFAESAAVAEKKSKYFFARTPPKRKTKTGELVAGRPVFKTEIWQLGKVRHQYKEEGA